MKLLWFIFFGTIALSMCTVVTSYKDRYGKKIPINYRSETQFNHSALNDEINDVIQPYCTYYGDVFEESIACKTGMTVEDFTAVFKNLSAILPDDLKKFQRGQFGVSQDTLELNDDVFGGILFEEWFFDLENGGHLNFTVDRSQNIYNNTRMFYIAYLTSYSIDFNEEYVEVLQHFTNLRSLSIVKWLYYPTKMSVNLTRDFFDNFPELTELYIATGSILGIDSYTFWNTNMTNILLFNIPDLVTKEVPEYAFAHKNPSNSTLTITFNVNGTFQFIDALFPTDSLIGINRPTRLFLSGDIQQSYLPEYSIKPFLLENEGNLIGFYKPYPGLDCTACRNYWVQQYNLTSRIDERCINGNMLSDESNWPNCHGM